MSPTLRRTLSGLRKKAYNLSTHFGYRYDLKIYDKEFFESNQSEGERMAGWFVPLLLDTFHFKSLIDVGCGTGHYLRYCLDAGVSDVFGIEGAPSAFDNLLVDKQYVTMHDLRTPFHFQRKWDLAISIEVAEHIDKLYAGNFMKILTDSSDTVVLTAAYPGQGGTAHVNEQRQEWWIARFKERNSDFSGELTNRLKRGIAEAREAGRFVTTWFEPNIMVFEKRVSE